MPLLSQTPLRPMRGGAFPWWPASAPLSLWHSARTALWQGAHALGLGPGDRVLVPAYCCGVEVSVLLEAGLQVSYYRSGPGLDPDIDHLCELCRRRAHALLVIHFFGLPQPIAPLRAFAHEHGLVLIEDCAHALFARDAADAPLGSRADIAVFSLRKHLPVPNGGLLALAGGASSGGVVPGRPIAPGLRPTARSMAFLAAIELEHRWPRLHDGLRGAIRPPRPEDPEDAGSANGRGDLAWWASMPPEEFDAARGRWGASTITRAVLRRVDAEEVRTRRRRNYVSLLDELDPEGRISPLARVVPDGASPWLFPVVTRQPAALRRHLLAHGIQSFAFWRRRHRTIPSDGFAFEDRLRECVVALPVHHGLSASAVERIAAVVRAWSRVHA